MRKSFSPHSDPPDARLEMLELMTTGVTPSVDSTPQDDDTDSPVIPKPRRLRKRKSVVEEVRSSPEPGESPSSTAVVPSHLSFPTEMSNPLSAPSSPPITPPPSRRSDAGKRRERPPSSPDKSEFDV